MSFDIHGNPLKPGHCEVHPWINEGYPCSVCVAEDQRNSQHSQRMVLESEFDSLKRQLEETQRLLEAWKATGSKANNNWLEARDLLTKASTRIRHDHAYPMEVGPHHCDGCDLETAIKGALNG